MTAQQLKEELVAYKARASNEIIAFMLPKSLRQESTSGVCIA